MRGHLARAAAVASVAFTLIEAMLGALLVKLGYTAQSQSPHAARLSGAAPGQHAAAAGRAHPDRASAQPHEGYLRGSVRLTAPFAAVAGIFVVMVVGVTGSLAALGDTLFPGQFARAWRWRRIFPRPAAGWCAGAGRIRRSPSPPASSSSGCWCAPRGAATQWDNRGLSALVLLLLAAVYTLGLLDVILLAPLWVQVAHLLAADSLWASLVVLAARLTLEPVES